MDTAIWAQHHEYVWLIAGVCLMVLEAFVTGVGLMFAGMGALVVGALMALGLLAPEAYISQCGIFFVATALWATTLWRPLKKFHSKKKGYSNIVGDTAYVGSSGLSKDKGGEVTWSGTIMKAKLVPGAAVDALEAGSQVEIVEVSGATLTVKPKI